MSRLAVGGDDPLIEHLKPLFGRAEALDLLSAFIQESGLQQLRPLLFDSGSLRRVRVLTGDYLGITSPRALRLLLKWAGPAFECRVFETQGGQSFHPKSWRFEWEGGASPSSGRRTCRGWRWAAASSGISGLSGGTTWRGGQGSRPASRRSGFRPGR